MNVLNKAFKAFEGPTFTGTVEIELVEHDDGVFVVNVEQTDDCKDPDQDLTHMWTLETDAKLVALEAFTALEHAEQVLESVVEDELGFMYV